MARGSYLAVSDGGNYTRVVGRGNVSHTTTRNGDRIDVSVDPLISSFPLNSLIHAAQAIRCLRNPTFVSPTPSIRRLRLAHQDTEWSMAPDPPLSFPIDVVTDESAEDVSDAP